MKRALKIAGGLVALIVVVVVGFVVKVQLTYRRDFSSTPMPNVKASSDPAVIAHGAYVTHAVAHCSACHGGNTADAYSKPRTLNANPLDLSGGLVMPAGPFGTFRPANITPDKETGIGAYTDAELARIIRHGVARDGSLDAFMSFAVGPMSDEDLTAVISYLRSLPPMKKATGQDEWGVIAKALSGSFNPRMTTSPPYVAPGTISVERGAYLANGPALCAGCHSPTDPTKGFAPAGPAFSGEAAAEPDPLDHDAEFITPNLTPDPQTGVMTSWSEDAFVKRFRETKRLYGGSKMPWENFAQMTEEDLRSIYRYLRTVPPTVHVTGPSHRPAGWKPSAS